MKGSINGVELLLARKDIDVNLPSVLLYWILMKLKKNSHLISPKISYHFTFNILIQF